MRFVLLAFVAGVLALQQCAELPSAPIRWGLLAGVICAGSSLCVFRHRCGARVRIGIGVLCAMATGFAWAAWRAEWRLSDHLDPAWEQRDIGITGVVSSLPARFEQGWRFNFDIESADAAGAIIPRSVQLSWYAPRARGRARTMALPHIAPGQRWHMTVRLKRPHGNANPHGFDYEAWLLAQGIRATGYVRAGKSGAPQKLDDFVPAPTYALARLRDKLRERINNALPAGAPYAGILTALAIGDQRAIAPSDWQLFQRTGVNHLVAISGLHITLVAGLIAGLARWLWRRSCFTGGQWPLHAPAQRIAVLAGLLAAVTYAALAGFGVPAQRAAIMLSIVALAYWTGRQSASTYVLAWALAIVVFVDPWAVLSPGFWLSFGAVGVILHASATDGRRATPGRWRGLRQAVRVQYAVTLGMAPLTVALFAQLSVVGPFANAVAIPLVSLLVTPMALTGMVLPLSLGAWVLGAAHTLIAWLAVWLHWLAALPVAVWRAPVPPHWITLLALAGLAWMLAPRGWPMRWMGAGLLMPVLWRPADAPPPSEFRLVALDIGQGTAALIETAHHRLLYDTGPKLSATVDAGARVIVPYLYARGIDRLDRLVISHQDDDHAGGALSVLAGVEVAQTLSSLPLNHPAVAASRRHDPCLAGQSWEWDGVRFDMLYPDAAVMASKKVKPNGRSCVLRVSNGKHAALLPGDIEKAQERTLLQQEDAGMLAADIVLAPHHGSLTSSTPAFVAAVSPHYVMYQAGYLNRFGHPRPAVVERYRQQGSEGFYSDRHGAVTFGTRGDALDVEAYRVAAQRYWMGR